MPLRLKSIGLALCWMLMPAIANAKGPPPHCETLTRAKGIDGLNLPAATELCRESHESGWSWAELPESALRFPQISLNSGATGRISLKATGWDRHRVFVQGMLSRDALIAGIPFRAGEVEFYKQYSSDELAPARGTLAKSFALVGTSFPAGTNLQWSLDPMTGPHLRLAILPEASPAFGHRLAKGNILFHPRGGAESYSLAAATTIDGVPCAAIGNDDHGLDREVSFYPSGQLKSCVLAASLPRVGIAFPEGSRLDFYSDGKLRAFSLPRSYPADTVKLGSVECDTSRHGFHKNMVPESQVAALSSEADGISMQFNALLFRNGQVAYCDIDSDQNFGGIPLSAGASGFVGVSFYESGKVRSGHLGKSMTICGINLPAKTGIELEENGNLKSIEDHGGLTVGGKKYPYGERIEVSCQQGARN